MSTHSGSALFFILLTGVSPGQPFRGPLDASNAEIPWTRPADIRGPAGLGTISLQEVKHPLEGKGLRLLVEAQRLVEKGERASALVQIRAAMQEPSAEPYAISMLAAEHLKQGDVVTAEQELRTAVAMLPGLAANRSNLAYALGVLQRNEEALLHARKAVQLDPANARTRFVIGRILLQLGQREEAEFHLRKAAPDHEGARKLLARDLAAAP